MGSGWKAASVGCRRDFCWASLAERGAEDPFGGQEMTQAQMGATTLLRSVIPASRRALTTVVVVVAAVLLEASHAQAATINVSSPYGPTEVASAFSSASNGDLVLMPTTGGPFFWTAPVTLPSTKCLTLDLNGRNIVLSGASGNYYASSARIVLEPSDEWYRHEIWHRIH